MIEERRKAYLEAMGYDVWVARPPPPQPGSLMFSSGKGSVLLVCDEPSCSATKLSGDIARALGQDPVWAWPATDDEQASEQIENAVSDRLLTDVIVFGQSLARSLFQGDPPEFLGSAKVSVASGMDELTEVGEAKRAFWTLLRGCRHSVTAAST